MQHMGQFGNSQEQIGKSQLKEIRCGQRIFLEMGALEPVDEHPCASEISGGRGTERVMMNLDTGAAITTFPSEFGPEQLGSDRMYKTAHVSLVADGGTPGVSGIRWAGPLETSTAEELQHTRCWQALEKWQFEIAQKHGSTGLLPLCLEDQIYNSYVEREVRAVRYQQTVEGNPFVRKAISSSS